MNSVSFLIDFVYLFFQDKLTLLTNLQLDHNHFKYIKIKGISLVGIKEVTVEYAKMEIADGIVLELVQYHSHPPKKNNTLYPSNRHGCSHLALTVDDIDQIYSKLMSYDGAHCNSPPLRSPDGNVRVFYAHDPDGIILELVQDL